MKISQVIFLGLALFLTVQFTAAHHLSNCGLGSGTDACGCSGVVVKPAKSHRFVQYADPYVIKEAHAARSTPVQTGCGSLHPPRKMRGPSVTDLLKHNCGPIAPKFQPIGDLCSTCKKSIVEVVPAYPGKPMCNSCVEKAKQYESGPADPRPNSYASYTSFSSPNSELNDFDDDPMPFDEQENIYNSHSLPAVPVDPVSLSLAYGAARQSGQAISEGGLAFGPKRTPIDGSVRKTVNNFPEEKLLIVERPVVELKVQHRQNVHTAYDEVLAQQEALEQQRMELEAEASATAESGNGPFISYGQLGYGLVSSGDNKFTNTISTYHHHQEKSADDTPCGPVGQPIPGYVSGNVIVRRQGEQETNSDYYNEGSYEQDSSSEQYDDSSSGESSEEVKPCHGGSGLLARLRSSARSQTGCGCGYSH